MRVISLKQRLAIRADCDAGLGTQAVGERHGVRGTFVRSLKQRRRLTGRVPASRKRGPGRTPKIDRAQLQTLVAADADATLAELRERLGIPCSLSALWTVLHDLKSTFKKNAPRRGARPARHRRTPRRVAGRAGRPRPAAGGLRR